MPARRGYQAFEVVAIDCDNLVSVDGEQHDPGVHDVRHPSRTEQLTRRTPERFVEGPHIDAVESSGQPSLARTAPPHVTKHTRVCKGQITGHLSGL